MAPYLRSGRDDGKGWVGLLSETGDGGQYLEVAVDANTVGASSADES
jgi:hypothetical protein